MQSSIEPSIYYNYRNNTRLNVKLSCLITKYKMYRNVQFKLEAFKSKLQITTGRF